MILTAAEVAALEPDTEVVGDPETVADHVAPFPGEGGAVCFFRGGIAQSFPYAASILIAKHGSVGTDQDTLVLCRNPRRLFGRVLLARPSWGRPGVRGLDAAHVAFHALVGADGMSHEWDEDRGAWLRIPNVGGVVLGAGARIRNYATVQRGFIEDTIIGPGCDIGQHVNVGHGCVLGAHARIFPHASLAGSVRVGERATIWQGAMIREHVEIGAGAGIGQAANVLCDVPAGEMWAGNPAQKVR